MGRKQIMILGLGILILAIMVLGYGGWCKKDDDDHDTSSGSSAPTTVSRFLYVWGAAYNMSDGLNGDDSTLQNELITFCNQRDISGVFFYTDLSKIGSDASYRSALQSAISALHTNGISVQALAGDNGDKKWVLTANQSTLIGYVNDLLSFNGTIGFDGLDLDIEIYTADYGWVSGEDFTGTNGDLANQYLTLIKQVKSTISGAMEFSVATPITKFMDVTLPITFNSVSKPFYKHVQDICKVNLMDYQKDDATKTVTSASAEISYGGSVRVILETNPASPNAVSSNQSLENIITALQTAYSAKSSFSGIAIHHYTTYAQWFKFTETFNDTGGQQQWIVPAGVTSIQVDVRGAQGGSGSGNGGGGGGKGARVRTTLSVTPGETLYVYVGGQNGYNGGGGGGSYGAYPGGDGGGASDIRQGGTTLSNRVVVAGGGGGGGGGAGVPGGEGGNGGYNGGGGGSYSGGGGTQSAGGAGNGGGSTGDSGSGGSGGVCDYFDGYSSGGGGGGGFYGGGGGSRGGDMSDSFLNGSYGGGGGSSMGPEAGTTAGFQTGDGQIIITY